MQDCRLEKLRGSKKLYIMSLQGKLCPIMPNKPHAIIFFYLNGSKLLLCPFSVNYECGFVINFFLTFTPIKESAELHSYCSQRASETAHLHSSGICQLTDQIKFHPSNNHSCLGHASLSWLLRECSHSY